MDREKKRETKTDPPKKQKNAPGRDTLARPVIYSCLALARGRSSVAANRDHMTMVFEQCCRVMSLGGGPSTHPPSSPPLLAAQWVWVSDFHGFGVRDLNPAIGRAFLNLCATHYPERLARFVLVGAPPMFAALWRALKVSVCAETRAKVGSGGGVGVGVGRKKTKTPRHPQTIPPLHGQLLFLPYEPGEGGATAAGLREAGLGEELTAWLTTEMAQNRDPATAAAKAYPYAGAGAAVTVDGHDVRGTGDMIRLVEAAPAAALPFPRRGPSSGGEGEGAA